MLPTERPQKLAYIEIQRVEGHRYAELDSALGCQRGDARSATLAAMRVAFELSDFVSILPSLRRLPLPGVITSRRA